MSSRAIEAAKAFVSIYMNDAMLKRQIVELRGSLQNLNDAVGPMGTAIVAAGVAGGAGLLKLAADAEMTAVSFEVMLGSAAEAKTMIDQLNKLGAESPFGSAEFQQAAQTLLQYGIAAESVVPTISMLGDVAAGDAEKLSRLTLAFGQMSAAGRLMGQDVLQMINAGFNPLQQISAKTGESMLDLRKRMEAGGISAAEVSEAFRDATSAGGRFFGMTARINKTTGGQFMQLKDQVVMLARELGSMLLPIANKMLSIFSGLVAFARGWGKSLLYIGAAVVAAVSAIKALTFALAAYNKVQAIAQAMSGPKGWIMLAVGAAAATAAVVALDVAQEDIVASIEDAHQPLDNMAKDLDKLGAAGKDTKDSLQEIEQATKDVEMSMERMRGPVESAKAATQKFADALAKSGKFGMVAGNNPLVEQFREMETGYTDAIRKIQDEIAVLGGTATETGLELERMAEAGVNPQKVEELRKLIEKRDSLEKAREGKDFFEKKQQEMQAAAEEVRRSLGGVQAEFALERKKLEDLKAAGLISPGEMDAALRKNPQFAKLMDGGIVNEFTKASAAISDLKTTGGSLITDVLNQTGNIQQNQLNVLKDLKKVADAQLQEAKKTKAYKV